MGEAAKYPGALAQCLIALSHDPETIDAQAGAFVLADTLIAYRKSLKQ